MSLSSKALITAATVVVGKELRRFAGTVEVDDLLRPMGLKRRRTHLGESLLFMGAGVVLGGVVAMTLASTTRYDITEWFSKGAKNAANKAKAVRNQEKPGAGSGGNGHSIGVPPLV